MKSAEVGTYKYGGAMADYCVTDASMCFPFSDDLTFEDTASFIVNPLTAVCMIERIK
jgi:NADPH:quinone reductase-like Zn-dependent oxidoreductase